jgi:hypothetical protein
MTVAKSTKKKSVRKNPVVARKPLTKEFISHMGFIKAIYHTPIGMWKLYKRFGTKWKLLGAVRGTAKTTEKNLLAKLPKEPTKAAMKKKTVRKKNPLQKYVCYVGGQFPDTEKGKKECVEFAHRFANKHGVVVHVYKA